MVDRIDGPTPGQTRKPDAGRVGSSQQTPQSGNRDEPVQDVSATTASNRESEVFSSSVLKRAEAELATSSEVNREQVNRIKEAISNGEFRVDAGRVAQAFIELESLLNSQG